MKELQLTLSIEETNLILSSLSRRPLYLVQALVAKIQTQANKQLTEQNKPKEP
jgi:hypothetical protein